MCIFSLRWDIHVFTKWPNSVLGLVGQDGGGLVDGTEKDDWGW